MNLPIDLLQHAASPVAQAVVAGLWQGIALALVTGVALRFLPGTSASARFAVWTAVLCASAAMPLVHLFTAGSSSIPASPSQVVLDPRWSYLLAVVWLGAAIFRFVRLIAEAVSLRKLWREAQPLSLEVLEAARLQTDLVHCTDWPASFLTSTNRHPEPGRARTLRQTESKYPEQAHATQTALTFLPQSARKVQVCTTADVDRPSVIGFFAPKILIPGWLLVQLSPTELRHIVLHEMEHLRRRDDWLNLLQKLGLALFPLNPAMFWIDRRLSTEREIACDDGVLQQTNTPRAYAASLTSVAERRLHLEARRRMVALALGIFGSERLLAHRSEFARRIESILGQRAAGRPAIAALLIAAIFGGSAAVISHTPELISFSIAPPQVAAANAAPADAVVNPAARSQTFAPRFVNASLRFPDTQMKRPVRTSPGAAIHAAIQPPTALLAISMNKKVEDSDKHRPGKRNRWLGQAKPEWLVLASYKEDGRPSRTKADSTSNFASDDQGGDVVVPVSRVVLRTPDGRFFATPYAAVPTQAGWLIVQL